MKTTDLSFAGVVLAGALLCLPALAGEVHAAVDGVNSTKGHVICGIFRSAEGFPKETQRAFKLVSLPANPAGVLCAFSDLPAGTYAISVFHDENDDGVLNTNFVGMPREGYGASNNHTYATHAPNFEGEPFHGRRSGHDRTAHSPKILRLLL
jgi:uncharacterized protein (DUF2141 family)